MAIQKIGIKQSFWKNDIAVNKNLGVRSNSMRQNKHKLRKSILLHWGGGGKLVIVI